MGDEDGSRHAAGRPAEAAPMTPEPRGRHSSPDGVGSPWLVSATSDEIPEETHGRTVESARETSARAGTVGTDQYHPHSYDRTTSGADTTPIDRTLLDRGDRAASHGTRERGFVIGDDTAPADSARAAGTRHMRPADEAGDPASPESTPSGQTTPEPARPEMMGTVNAIEVKGLHKRFKDVVAVDSVTFDVPAGSIVALLGPNGAGKTTVVNMLCTLLAPSGGTATVAGHDVVEDAADVRRSIMLTGQFAALDEALTGAENLVLFGRLLGLPKSVAKERAADLLEQFGLTAASDRRVREYSGGMRRRIDIACGLVTMPKVVFLDEPTTGLDPRSRQEVWTLVSALRDRGVTTLLTTQYLEEADALSDRIVVIDRGRVIAEGTADELKNLIGTSYCQVTPVHVQDLPKLRELLADLIGEESQPAPRLPLIDSDDTGGFGAVSDSTGDEVSVAVPAPDGAETLVEIVRRTASADIRLSDVALRRPSLDEVFLALTDPTRHDASALSPATEPA